jgi:4-amino-4-deoxy-L-arabinose transferase-like glycosyltransferase
MLLQSLLPIFLGALLWIGARPTFGGPGLTWDEAYYFPAFRDAAGWVSLLLGDPGTALSTEGISDGWQEINELPPLTKWLGAATFLLPGEGWNRLSALRVFPAVLFAATLILLWRSALCLVPWRWAWLAPALYASHPVLTGHAQLAASETVFCAVTSLTLWLMLRRPERSLVGALLLGGALGLALATKVNGLILVVGVVGALVAGRLLERRRLRGWLRQEGRAIFLVVLIAPCLALAIWPWMWPAVGERLIGYGKFITEHSHQGVWFAGARWNFGGPPAPLYYPLAMAHLMTPLALLIVFWAGLGAILVRTGRRRRLPRKELILMLFLLGPIMASSLPSSPKYDGVRLFLPLFVPAVLLGVRGLWLVCLTARRRHRVPMLFLAVLPVVSFGMPNIDFYNLLAQRGFAADPVSPWETTYWVNGLDLKSARDLNVLLDPGARVKTLALQPLVIDTLTEWNLLRADIVWNGEPPYDHHLVQNRKGFWGNAEWSIYSMREPQATWGEGSTGEPLMYLYDGRPPGQ